LKVLLVVSIGMPFVVESDLSPRVWVAAQ
jgi:hypothetical protein